MNAHNDSARPDECAAPRISVIIPARDEAQAIRAVLDRAMPYADELLVVDGHSRDDTAAIARSCGARVLLDDGGGKGSGYRRGIEEATGDLLVFLDGDGSHEPHDIPAMIRPLADHQAEMVIASRLLGGSDEIHGTFSNYARTVGAGLITLILNWRFKTSLTDSINGFRAIRRGLALDLHLASSDFCIEQEMVIKVLKRGGRIVEVPSHEYCRQGGESKLPTIQGLKFLFRLLWDIV